MGRCSLVTMTALNWDWGTGLHFYRKGNWVVKEHWSSMDLDLIRYLLCGTARPTFRSPKWSHRRSVPTWGGACSSTMCSI